MECLAANMKIEIDKITDTDKIIICRSGPVPKMARSFLNREISCHAAFDALHHHSSSRPLPLWEVSACRPWILYFLFTYPLLRVVSLENILLSINPVQK